MITIITYLAAVAMVTNKKFKMAADGRHLGFSIFEILLNIKPITHQPIFCRETPGFLSPTKLSGFLAHHTLADFLSPIFCRVTSRAFAFYAGTVKRSRQNDPDKKDMK